MEQPPKQEFIFSSSIIRAFSSGLNTHQKQGIRLFVPHWGFPRTALGLLKAMDTAEVSPDARTFNAAIACCEPRGHWQLASHLLEAMTEAQLQPNATTRTSMRGFGSVEFCF